MLTPFNSYTKGFSKETIILVTSLLTSGLIRHNEDKQLEPVINLIRNEIVDLNGLRIDLRSGALIFSELLKIHQHSAMNNQNNADITLECGSSVISAILKACSIKSNVTISDVKGFVKKFCDELSNNKKITVTKHNFKKKKIIRENSFTIFSTLKYNDKENTLTFRFSEDFISFINAEGKAITIIQNDDFRKVKSNKTSGILFLMSQSISNLNNKKRFKQEYLINVLVIKKNANQILNNAFENLEKNGMLVFEKMVSSDFFNGKWTKYSEYTISNIKKAVVNVVIKAKNIIKKATITMNSKQISKKEGMKIFKAEMNKIESGCYDDYKDYKFGKILNV